MIRHPRVDKLTERHLNFIRDTFNTHEGERNNCDDGYSAPSQILDESERKGKEVECDALLQMNSVYTKCQPIRTIERTVRSLVTRYWYGGVSHSLHCGELADHALHSVNYNGGKQ